MDYFYSLSFAQQVYLDEAVRFIVYNHFHGDMASVMSFVWTARARKLDVSDVVDAVLWLMTDQVTGD